MIRNGHTNTNPFGIFAQAYDYSIKVVSKEVRSFFTQVSRSIEYLSQNTSYLLAGRAATLQLEDISMDSNLSRYEFTNLVYDTTSHPSLGATVLHTSKYRVNFFYQPFYGFALDQKPLNNKGGKNFSYESIIMTVRSTKRHLTPLPTQLCVREQKNGQPFTYQMLAIVHQRLSRSNQEASKEIAYRAVIADGASTLSRTVIKRTTCSEPSRHEILVG
jgi:hypothetical protein